MSDTVNIVSPVGRFVWGSYPERETEGYQGVKYEPGKGPVTLGLAVRKDHDATLPAGYTGARLDTFMAAIYNTAVAFYNAHPGIKQKIDLEWQHQFTLGGFKFKIKDGDKPNDKGVVNQNTAGCWVFALSTHFADAKACDRDMKQIDASTIVPGHFIDISVGIKPNELLDNNAGVHLNPNFVRLIAFGEKITGGMSAEAAFGSAPVPTSLPAGASLTPLAGAAPAALPNATPAPAAVTTGMPLPGGSPAPAGAPTLPTASPTNVQPHTAFLNAAPVGLPLPGQ